MKALSIGKFAVLVLLLFSAAAPASAEELRWRLDYAAGRREALAANRPFVLDFGTEQCFWCKKLDATTFRDPQVARLLAERFIPIRVDGDREMALTQSLGIQSYPTVIVASAEGKILGRHDGYVDTAGMMRMLHQALAQTPAPTPETARAPAENPIKVAPLPPPQVALRTTSCPAEPADAIQERQARAQSLLAQAQRDLDQGCPLSCLERCKLLTTDYADLAEAGAARAMTRRIVGDTGPALAAGIDTHFGDLYVELAETLLRRQQHAEASRYLERAAQLSPGSASARKAQDQLDRLRPELAGAKTSAPIIRAQSP